MGSAALHLTDASDEGQPRPHVRQRESGAGLALPQRRCEIGRARSGPRYRINERGWMVAARRTDAGRQEFVGFQAADSSYKCPAMAWTSVWTEASSSTAVGSQMRRAAVQIQPPLPRSKTRFLCQGPGFRRFHADGCRASWRAPLATPTGGERPFVPMRLSSTLGRDVSRPVAAMRDMRRSVPWRMRRASLGRGSARTPAGLGRRF